MDRNWEKGSQEEVSSKPRGNKPSRSRATTRDKSIMFGDYCGATFHVSLRNFGRKPKKNWSR